MELLAYEKEHLKMLREHLAECMVLLKSNGDFPIEEPGKVALYGSGARHTIKGGTGSGEVNSRFSVNVEEGLTEAGFTITTKKWLDEYDGILDKAYKDFVKELKEKAKKMGGNAIYEFMGAVMPEPEYSIPIDGEGDAAIYVLGRISGEGSDRQAVKGDVLLSDTEVRDILEIKNKYKKVMLVLNVGGPVDLTPVLDVPNILILSQLGVEAGNALGDVLLGKANPSGKLTTTWTKWEDYPTVGEFGNKDDTRYTEGIYVGYRYFDSVGKKALFPFGFGKSFTDFDISCLGVSKNGENAEVKVKVTNLGKISGKEVVQLYVSVPSGKLDQPYQTLAGFAKTNTLLPGDSEELKVEFKLRDISSYSTEDAAYILEAGKYLIRLGNSSTDTSPVAVINIEEEIVTRKLRGNLLKVDYADWKPDTPAVWDVPNDLPVISFGKADINTELISYDHEEKIEPVLEEISEEELIYLNLGQFKSKGGFEAIIGNAGKSVAGAAGETSDVLKEKGIGTIVMADGPAGLRISRDYFIDKGTVYGLETGIPETMLDLLPGAADALIEFMKKKPGKKSEILHQYATAIPIGTAIAQSWNYDFAEMCGDIVGSEMERFKVQLWLAPALNIHRSILCGRNFEYYSEDPLISGIFAAAITNGVQKHPGCGTTIKHFAANNQEYKRYVNNSVVSERALRDIYLKGFDICIRESAPLALMTSYNLINGQHTSEWRELVDDVLRREFGYEGLVMTDWTITGWGGKGAAHPEAVADRIAAAAVDITMPGGKTDFNNIKKALRDGRLTVAQLKENASRTVRMARRLN